MTPLMPKSIALWLIEKTSLTFEQIADFCGLHILEVEALANEDHPKTLQAFSPIISGDLTEEEIKQGEADSTHKLKAIENTDYEKYLKSTKKHTSNNQSKFKRKAKPEAILWLLNNYPHISEYQISKLLATTTNTVKAIKSKAYWNYANLVPKNPVNLGLCTEVELSEVIHKANEQLKTK